MGSERHWFYGAQNTGGGGCNLRDDIVHTAAKFDNIKDAIIALSTKNNFKDLPVSEDNEGTRCQTTNCSGV